MNRSIVHRVSWVTLCMALGLSACGKSTAPPSTSSASSADGPRELIAGVHGMQQPRATPEEEHIDPVALGAAADYAGAHNSTALLVGRHGHLVFERYWGGTGRDTVVDAGAFSRTVAAMMVGIAIDDRLLLSLDEPAATYLEAFRSPSSERITIRELLQRDDAGPLVRLVESTAGTPYVKYTSRKLWKRLEAGDAWMVGNPAGGVRADCCFFARQGDWLRLAQLLMSDGEFQGKQILPQGWAGLMLGPSPRDPELGYQVRRGTPRDGYYLSGPGKSRLWLQPALHLAILRLGSEPKDWNEARIPETVVNGVLDRPRPAPAQDGVDLSKLVPHH